MRYLLLLALSWQAASDAACQSTAWTYTSSQAGLNGAVTDIIEIESGAVVSVHFRNTELTYSKAILDRLDQDGNQQASTMLWNTVPFASCKRLLRRDQVDVYDCIGQVQYADGHFTIGRIGCNSDLIQLDSASMVIPEIDFMFLDEAISLSDGSILATGTSIPSPGGFPPIKLFLGKFGPDGDSLAYASYINPYFQLIPRSMVEVDPDTILITTVTGFAEVGNAQSKSSVTRLDQNLSPSSAFRLPAIDGSGTEPDINNAFFDLQEIHMLSQNMAVIGGCTQSGGSAGTRSAILKMSLSDSTWLGSYQFGSGYPSDVPGLLSAMDTTIDGNLLFAMTANYHWSQPPSVAYEPSQIRVYQLDTALNLICSNIVDGFMDNTYYVLQRIRSTADGGYILMGSRTDLSLPEIQFEAWAQKFTAQDCFASMNEIAGGAALQVFPNPGNDELHITLNGPRRAAIIALYDTNGKVVSTAQIQQGSGRLNTSAISDGVYLYRVVDAQGALAGSGYWVRE